MIKFTKKLAIITSLMILSAGYFNVLASEDGLIPLELESPPAQGLAVIDTVTPITVEDAKEGFFPQVPIDLKSMLSRYLCRVNNALILARVNKGWHYFILDTEFIPKDKSEWAPILLSARNNLVQQSLAGWWAQRDLETLKNGIFRYQPGGSTAIDVQLSDMYMDTTNGELTLPETIPSDLCVTRMTEKFLNPVYPNTKKTIFLLLTLSELKRIAEQISTHPAFLRNVSEADLSQKAVCMLSRHGGDDITTWGFNYTILRFGEMNKNPIFNIYGHKKVPRHPDAGTGWRALPGGEAGGILLMMKCRFCFEPKS